MSECSVLDSDEHCGEKLTKEGGTGNSEQVTRDDFTEKVILVKTYRKERSFYFSSVTWHKWVTYLEISGISSDIL